jgi:3-hydroxybutyryl-CoA dehydrogenase
MIATNIKSLSQAEFITPEQAGAAEKNLSYASEIKAAADVDLVVEAVPENVKIKASVYKSLDEACRKDAILTSTTSAMNIYEEVTVSHPERLLIAHWCNPPHILPLVEIVVGPETDPEIVTKVREQLEQIGKSPVVLTQYIPGFIVNRLNFALMRECSYMVEQGWISAEDVDIAYCANQGMKAPFEGPLEMVDHIGWDIGFAAGMMLYPFISSSTEPSEMAQKMLSEGRLGVKSGRGLYDYSNKNREDVQRARDERVVEVVKLARKLSKQKAES